MATIAATLLLGVTPTIALINQPIHTVQAANKALKGKVVLKKSFNNTIQVFNSKGNAATTTKTVNGKKMTEASMVKAGSTFKYYGGPVLLQGKKSQIKPIRVTTTLPLLTLTSVKSATSNH